jgi:hypothetical protein
MGLSPSILVVVLLKVRCRFRAPLRGGVRLSGDELIFQASDGEVRLAFNMVTGQVRPQPPHEPSQFSFGKITQSQVDQPRQPHPRLPS